MFFGSLPLHISLDGFQGGVAYRADEVGARPKDRFPIEGRQVLSEPVPNPEHPGRLQSQNQPGFGGVGRERHRL